MRGLRRTRTRTCIFRTKLLIAAVFVALLAPQTPSAGEPVALPVNTALAGNVLARVAGNDHDSAQAIAKSIFSRIEPAQITKVTVVRVLDHRVAGIVISGVKFHAPLNRYSFREEVVSLIGQSFAASGVEEVDVRTVVPIHIGRGVVVSGDNASPSFREVFTVTARRGEALDALGKRIDTADGVFWEPWFLDKQLEKAAP